MISARSSHIEKVITPRYSEDIGYIACKKSFIGRRPKSTYHISRQSRAALARYLLAMQQLIDSVNGKQA
ncbi:MAG TPA: transcriptional regulator [Pirellulales bacterium]|nr:transcriptional regulator [Pirellulales bacterium]